MKISFAAAEVEPQVGAKSRSQLADRSTPFIRNQWYLAAWAEELSSTPFQRQILGQDIVLFRGEDGEPVALQNRCAHRSFPLSDGFVKGNRIVCGYHGIEFNADGSCGLIPSLNSAPRAMRVQHYPVVEQGAFLWIWMGPSDAADHSKLVEQHWATDPAWSYVKGYFHMEANYLGLHENLLDLTHFPFLHGAALSKPEHAESKPSFKIDGNVVQMTVLHEDVDVAPAFGAAYDLTAPIDRLSVNLAPTPALHMAEITFTDSSSPPRDLTRWVVHYMTPETQTSTHYFWAVARSGLLDNKEVDAEAQRIFSHAFEEDKIALEAIERLIARDDRPDFREKIISTDEGAIHMLRAFARMAADEQNSGARAA